MTTYTAIIALEDDVTETNLCDVSVVENELVDEIINEDGSVTPEYIMTDTVVLSPIQIDVRIDNDNRYEEAPVLALDALWEAGWERNGSWHRGDSFIYADVERIES